MCVSVWRVLSMTVLKIWEMLTSALKALVKNPVKESFDITFMGNEKSCQNINCFFFPIKNFFNLIFNQCPKGTR